MGFQTGYVSNGANVTFWRPRTNSRYRVYELLRLGQYGILEVWQLVKIICLTQRRRVHN